MSQISFNSEIQYKEIGKRLREVRGKLSQTAFGQPLNYKYGYVKSCESGNKPSLEYLIKVAIYYKISLDWLLLGIKSSATNDINTSDTDLENMLVLLKKIMNHDPDTRIWAKKQFNFYFASIIDQLDKE